jgi:hypothetical protein
MSNFDPRIEKVRTEYGLQKDDFWQIPQNKQWVCKHAALEVVATKAGVQWDVPAIVQADTANGIAVLIVSGALGERVEWATGEASPKNNKNAYPWAMAEKRAKDRVILKLVGIHGLVYSEDELDQTRNNNVQPAPTTNSTDAAKPISAAAMKRGLAEIDNDLTDCTSLFEVNRCAKVWAKIMERDGWSEEYQDFAKPKFAQRRADLESSQVLLAGE